MSWLLVGVFTAAFAITYSLMPRPEATPPRGYGDINVPTAEIGRDIPVLFGRRKIDGPNVVWYGDLRTTPIKSSGGKKG